MTYRYCWARAFGEPSLGGVRKGQTCRVVAWGPRGRGFTGNSALVEFADGFRAVVSRNSLRKYGGES